MIRFRVNGRPAPQGSKRHVGGGRMVESSRAVGPWREAVRAETVAQVWRPNGGRMLGPVSIVLVFLLDRPKSHYRTGRNAHLLRTNAPVRPHTRPDADKLARAALDGLADGGAFLDDAQVVDLNVSKVWCQPGETPGVVIEIEGAK